jgi:cation transport ATPase
MNYCFYAASLENSSEHPLAKAVISYAKQRNIRLDINQGSRNSYRALDLKETSMIDGVVIGSPRLFDDESATFI